MELVEKTYPLESIVDELVKTELQYEVLSAKSAKRLQMKLSHYEILKKEMLERHAHEVQEMDSIINRYKTPLLLREKTIKRKEEKLAELKGKLEGRSRAMGALSALPPAINEIVEDESDEERVSNEIVTGVKTYSMPR
jgi:predicted metal-binding protein